MVQYRKPVKLSDNIIDRRGEHAAKMKFFPDAGSDFRAKKKRADELIAEAVAQALKLRQRGGR